MTHFVNHAINDIRGGRETWRVLLLVSSPAFVIAVGFAALQSAF